MLRMSIAGHVKRLFFPGKKILSISFEKMRDNDRFQGFIIVGWATCFDEVDGWATNLLQSYLWLGDLLKQVTQLF